MKNFFASLKKWLAPGMNVKRWILLIALGLGLLGLSILALVDFTRLGNIKRWIIDLLIDIFGKNRFYTPDWYTIFLGSIVLILSIVFIIIGIRQLINSIITSLLPEREKEIADIVREYRFRNKILNVVVIGGGTGIYPYLQALKELPFSVTAIVTVADSGGSSGKIRKDYSIPAPGDIRRALVALSEHKQSYLEKLFDFRFANGSLAGHNLGNLIIAGLTEMTNDFSEAIYQLSKILSVKGKVIPFTLENLTLCAEFYDGSIQRGEAEIGKVGKRIKRVFFDPSYTKPLIRVIEELDKADIILIGPGSLYTSILPSLISTPLADIIARSNALKIYNLNLMTEKGETDNYLASDHIKAIFENTGEKIFDYVLINIGNIDENLIKRYEKYGAYKVIVDTDEIRKLGVIPLMYDLVYNDSDSLKLEENPIKEDSVIRHSPEKVKDALIDIVKKARYIRGKKTKL